MATTKTKVTVTKVEDNVQMESKAGGAYSAFRMTFSVQGVEEQKAFKKTWVENQPELNAALRELTTITSPVQVVILEEENQYGRNIKAIFPGTTPEENPRGPKAAKKSFSGGGGYRQANEPAIHRQVALKVAGGAAQALGINTTQGLITAAKELEVFLNELNSKTTSTEKPIQSVLGGLTGSLATVTSPASVFAQPTLTTPASV